MTIIIYVVKIWFVEAITYKHAGIAQSVEHFTRNEGVESSSLFSSFFLQAGNIPMFLAFFKLAIEKKCDMIK